MKVLFFAIAALFGAVLTGPAPQVAPEDDAPMGHFLVETAPGVYELEDLSEDQEIDARVSENDIVYHFYNQRDPDVGVDITSDNIEELRNTRFSRLRDTVFIIHGWKSDNISSFNNNVRQAVLSQNNVNLFAVDWSPIAQRNYISAKNSVVGVGRLVALFIRSLESRYNLRLSRVTLVGFSLGAHIAGNTGAALNGEIEEIVGLDPAGPLFSNRNIDERLDPTDGQFVHVIHTNGGTLGFKNPSGHVDFYPNGGSSQPGCGLDVVGSCAHSRAYLYYSESVSTRTNLFVGQLCSSYRDYGRDRCADNPTSRQGDYPVDKRATQGEYYLDTNNASPFARG